MKEINDAILAVTGFKREVMVNDQLRIVDGPSSAGINFDVWDGKVRFARTGPNPLEPVIVTKKLPYAVFYGGPGTPVRRRASGEYSKRSEFFGFRSVGITREQAEWVLEELQDALLYTRLVLSSGRGVELVSVEQSNRIFRDDEAVQPNGGPIFYGEDYYSVRVMLNKRRGAA